MSWSEFKLRLFSYNRQQEDELLKLRRLAWVTLIAPYQDPKKLRGKKDRDWETSRSLNSLQLILYT